MRIFVFAAFFLLGVSAAGNHPTINRVPKALSPIISITANSEITIPIGVDEAFIRAGSTAVFKCEWKGYPRPNITWLHNRNAINYTKEYNNKYQSVTPNILEVKKLAASDAGVYSCMVENMFGRSMKKTKLEILEAPVILKSTTNMTFYSSTGHVKVDVGGGIIVLKGASVSLSCPATGKPTPTIKWSKRNTTFFVDPRFTLSNDKQLTIKNIQPSDSGDYFCTAKNNVASAKSFLRLLVADEPKADIIPNYRPKGTGKLNGVLDNGKLIVPAGSPLHLLCRVSGSPSPRIIWLKDHSILKMSHRIRVREGFIEVKYAMEDDAGTYVCILENLLGVTTAFIQVIIGAPPKIFKEEFTRDFWNKLRGEIIIGSSIKLNAGSTVKLHCNASGTPKPVIVWERDEKRFKKGVVKSQNVGSDVLTISAESTGNITCIAKNVFGMDRVTSTITVIGRNVTNPKLKLVDPCKLSPDRGDCQEYAPRYYYNATMDTCSLFTYSGCKGNGNNFQTKIECVNKCSYKPITKPFDGRTRSLQGCNSVFGCCSDRISPAKGPHGAGCPKYSTACHMPVYSGPCRALITRWYYDNRAEICKNFTWGGCQGNDNNFASNVDCLVACDEDYVNPAPVTDTAPEKDVEAVLYPGCGDSRYGCCSDGVSFPTGPNKKGCPVYKSDCRMPKVSGTGEKRLIRYYYDTSEAKCMSFLFFGSGGNMNNFNTLEECSLKCEEAKSPCRDLYDLCSVWKDRGFCLTSSDVSGVYCKKTCSQCLR